MSVIASHQWGKAYMAHDKWVIIRLKNVVDSCQHHTIFISKPHFLAAQCRGFSFKQAANAAAPVPQAFGCLRARSWQ